jgi:hypothetical protein
VEGVEGVEGVEDVEAWPAEAIWCRYCRVISLLAVGIEVEVSVTLCLWLRKQYDNSIDILSFHDVAPLADAVDSRPQERSLKKPGPRPVARLPYRLVRGPPGDRMVTGSVYEVWSRLQETSFPQKLEFFPNSALMQLKLGPRSSRQESRHRVGSEAKLKNTRRC